MSEYDASQSDYEWSPFSGAGPLELATNAELIQELCRRSTFCGVLVMPCVSGEVKLEVGKQRPTANLSVIWRNVTDDNAIRMLHNAILEIAIGENVVRLPPEETP